jgi:hypothetical protein
MPPCLNAIDFKQVNGTDSVGKKRARERKKYMKSNLRERVRKHKIIMQYMLSV